MIKRCHVVHGVDVIGPVDPYFDLASYFFDSAGHQLGMPCRMPSEGKADRNFTQAMPILTKLEQRKASDDWNASEGYAS